MQQASSAGVASASVVVVLTRYSITRKQLPILGVIQIIVALIVLVFGILRATRSQNVVSDSLVYIWGPVALILAGCMTIYDGTSQRPKIQSAVALNVAAGVASLVTAIIFFLDVTDAFNTSEPPFWHPDPDTSNKAFSGFSAVLCLFELALCGFSAGTGHPGGCCDPPLQVRTALGFNVVAAVASAIGMIIYSADADYLFKFPNYNYYYSHQDWSYLSGAVCCVLAVFCALKFVVSICVAAFACYDVCSSTNQMTQAPPTYANASPREGPSLYESPTF